MKKERIEKLNYLPPGYPYPQYAHTHPQFRSNVQALPNPLLDRIKGEATAVHLYSQLVEVAPDQNQRNSLIQMLEEENGHLQQLTNQYIGLTGSQPFYEIEEITFVTFQEGLQAAFELKCKSYEDYRNDYLFTQPSPIRELFLQTFNDEAKHIQELENLRLNRNERVTDYGMQPFVVNIEEATEQNNAFRSALWTGDHFQITLMSLNVGEDIGLEKHPDVDQFLRVEQGQGIVQMGDRKDQLGFQREVFDDFAIVIPAGKWHNLTNTGNVPLKLYSIYAPPQHPFGTVQETKAEAMEAEQEHHRSSYPY